jgi:capsular polysaccharide transport system permease protein
MFLLKARQLINFQALIAQIRDERLKGRFVSLLRQQELLRLTLIASLMAIVYWGVIASDRYVSEAHVVIQSVDHASSGSIDIASILSGSGGSSRGDQLFLRDYLLSVDMMNKLDRKLKLREHFSNWRRDPLSRMWFKNTDQEKFHDYFLSRISVVFDDYSGVLIVKAQGYDAKTAHAIASELVHEGELAMNEMAHRLAQEQVAFSEKLVADSAARLMQARNALLSYQNSKGLVSPQSYAESVAATISRLEAQRSDLETRRTALSGYLALQAPDIVELNMQIEATNRQIGQEKTRLTSPQGNSLNSTVEEFQRLEMNAKFAEDVYKTALTSLEASRIEASRTLKKVSILQQPTIPQYPTEPRRIYNIIVFILAALILAGIISLLAAIIRDHKD